MTEDCSRFDLLLMVYADGEATPDERRAIEMHVQNCVHCRARLAEWQALRQRTNTLIGAMVARQVRDATTPPTATGSIRRRGPPSWERLGDPASAGSTPVAAHRPTQPRADASVRRSTALGLLVSVLAALLIPLAVSRHIRPEAVAATNPGYQAAVPIIGATVTPVGAIVTPAAMARSMAPRASATAAPGYAVTATPLPAVSDTVHLSGKIAAVLSGDLRVYSATGSRLLTSAGAATAPRWSPSGRWLLYESTGPASSAVLRLLQPGASAAPWRLPAPADSGLARWSPRRDEIAVASSSGGLWLVQAGSDSPRPLLPAGGSITNLAWSPDGSEVAVERRGVGGAAQSIWLVSRGGSITQVSVGMNDARPANTGVAGASIAPAPGDPLALPVLGTWDPQSEAFTFWTSRGLGQRASTPAPLALWSRHGGERVMLPAVLMYRDFVSWAPDGHALAAVAPSRTRDGHQGPGQVTVVPVRPQGPAHELTDPGRADGDAAWSPDGVLIAYASSLLPSPSTAAGSSRRIWLEGPDGSGRRPLSAGPLDSFPQWSKDGKEIIYVHQEGDSAQLWVVARDGSDPHPVVDSIVGLQQLPHLNFGNSGLASYRGVFAWSDAAGGD